MTGIELPVDGGYRVCERPRGVLLDNPAPVAAPIATERLGMRLVELITIRLEQLPSLGWLQLVTDEGIVGLGETCLHLDAVEGYLHEVAAPRLLGEEPRDIERHARRLYDSFTGWGGSGAETKGNSAVDVALWDILGQSPRAAALPPARRALPREHPHVQHVRRPVVRPGARRRADPQLEPAGRRRRLGAYEDLDAFLHRAGELAENLLAEGLTAMKIWPFDSAALAHDGLSISADELRAGDRADRARCAPPSATAWTSWSSCTRSGSPAPAKAIARALEEYEPYWVEDAVKLDDMLAVSRFIDSTPLPCTVRRDDRRRARATTSCSSAATSAT